MLLIADTTRTVYERKLMRMLQGDVHAEGSYSHDTSDAVEYEEVVDDDTDVQAAGTSTVRYMHLTPNKFSIPLFVATW